VGILLIAPFYGKRRPSNQRKWFLRVVHSMASQAVGIALEAACLLHWAREFFSLPVALTGISYGGAMSALASKLYPYDVAIVPYMGCNGPGKTYAYGAQYHCPN
jgi:cephalosporin-C deacetylase-like acetyl esterase